MELSPDPLHRATVLAALLAPLLALVLCLCTRRALQAEEERLGQIEHDIAETALLAEQTARILNALID